MKSTNLLFKMNSRRKTLTTTSLLILVLKIFSGNSLTCHPAEYLIGHECCLKCPPGNRVKTHCTEYRTTSCLPCLEGTYMNLPTGLQSCLSCTNCDIGPGLRIKYPCTSALDTVCEPVEGFFCIDSVEKHCVAARSHTRCQPGQFISQKGTALKDTVCSDCSEGHFSNGTTTFCQPHTQCESKNLQLIKPGTSSTDAECGEPGLDYTTVVISFVLVLVLIGLIAAGVIYFVQKKKERLQVFLAKLSRCSPSDKDKDKEGQPMVEEGQQQDNRNGVKEQEEPGEETLADEQEQPGEET